jgi:hypothetical protein
MQTRLALAIVTWGALLASVPARAHHSFAAEFDSANCKDFSGTLTKVDWQNPHAYFYMDVKDASGKAESWSFQTYALITLKRAGLERQVFVDNVGKEVWVRGCIAKNGKKNYAAAGTMKFPDGVLRQVGQLQD